MKIEDRDDFNKVNCCPCGLPFIPFQVQRYTEGISSDGFLRGFTDETKPLSAQYDIKYKQFKYTYKSNPNTGEPGHTTTYTYNDIYDIAINGHRITPPIIQTIVEGGGNSYTQPVKKEVFQGIPWETGRQHIIDTINGAVDFANPDYIFSETDMFQTGCVQPFIFSPHFTGIFVQGNNQAKTQHMRYKCFLPEEVTDVKYFKLEWDEAFVPKDWETWFLEVENRKAIRKVHADWVDCMEANPAEGENFCGPEPENAPEDQDPPEPSNKPQLLNHRTYEFDGTNRETPFFEITPVDISEVDGTVYMANGKFFSYRSARLGSLPEFVTAQFPIPAPTQ